MTSLEVGTATSLSTKATGLPLQIGNDGIVPRQGARVMIEVDEKASDIADKFKRDVYERFKKLCPRVLVIALTGRQDSEYYTNPYKVDVFILSDEKLKANPTEFRRRGTPPGSSARMRGTCLS